METTYLDYTISMSGDGITITKNGTNCMPGAMNFGKEWTEEALTKAKRSATLLFMIARPEKFGAALYYRLTGRGGAYWEHGTLKNVLKEESIPMPEELANTIGDISFLIGFNGKPLNQTA